MPKTFPEELAEWVSKRKGGKSRQDKHVVAFLAIKADVKAALDAGYSMKTIWEYMKEAGRIEYRYETFTQHVKRYIKAPEVETASRRPPAPNTLSGNQTRETGPGSKELAKVKGTKIKGDLGKIDGFTFDATPKKEDLL